MGVPRRRFTNVGASIIRTGFWGGFLIIVINAPTVASGFGRPPGSPHSATWRDLRARHRRGGAHKPTPQRQGVPFGNRSGSIRQEASWNRKMLLTALASFLDGIPLKPQSGLTMPAIWIIPSTQGALLSQLSVTRIHIRPPPPKRLLNLATHLKPRIFDLASWMLRKLRDFGIPFQNPK